MTDIAQFASIAGLATLVTLIVQVAKVVLPLSEREKAWIPASTVLLSVVLAVLIGVNQGHIKAGADWLPWILGGFLAGAQAIGVYELAVKPARDGLGLGKQQQDGSGPTFGVR